MAIPSPTERINALWRVTVWRDRARFDAALTSARTRFPHGQRKVGLLRLASWLQAAQVRLEQDHRLLMCSMRSMSRRMVSALFRKRMPRLALETGPAPIAELT